MWIACCLYSLYVCCMAAKLVLNMKAATDEFFSDTALIGIGSALPGYKFCRAINIALNFDFTRRPDSDVAYQPSKDDKHYFSLYQYNVPLSSCKHLLYKLRSEKRSLLPEVKQLDYLWLIRSQLADEEARELIEQLRNIPDVQLAQHIPPDRLRNINNLVL